MTTYTIVKTWDEYVAQITKNVNTHTEAINQIVPLLLHSREQILYLQYICYSLMIAVITLGSLLIWKGVL